MDFLYKMASIIGTFHQNVRYYRYGCLCRKGLVMASRIGAHTEENYMANRRRCIAVPLRAYSFRNVQLIILDTHFISHILCKLNFPIGRVFMTDQEDHVEEQREEEKKSETRHQAREELEQLKIHAIVSIGSLVAFVVFGFTLIVANLLSNIWPQVGMILRIVAWPITICGAICCVSVVLTSVVRFLRYLIKKCL